MSNVFIGGSRKLGPLHPAVRTRLRSLIANKHTVLIGDADGIDKAVQAFFAEEGYKNVIVYCMDDECRNNVGGWQRKSVESGGKRKGFAYYTMKDAQMSLDADCGFMIWDGVSKGTLNNVLNLVQQCKPAWVYHSSLREFMPIKTTADVLSLVESCPADVVEHFNRTVKLEKRVGTSGQITLNFQLAQPIASPDPRENTRRLADSNVVGTEER